MPKNRTGRRIYPPEFRHQMVELVGAGRSPEELSREFEPSGQTIWNWVKQADRDGGGRSDGLTSEERAWLSRLHRARSSATQLPSGPCLSCGYRPDVGTVSEGGMMLMEDVLPEPKQRRGGCGTRCKWVRRRHLSIAKTRVSVSQRAMAYVHRW